MTFRRSRRTVRTGTAADQVLSPASNKKGGRECRQQKREGRTRRNRWGHQRHHPLQTSRGAVGAVYELTKKRSGPTRSQFDALPLHRRSNRSITRGSPTGRRHYDQTNTGVSNPRKSRGPTLCSVRRIHLLRMMPFYVRSVTNPAAIGRTAH